MFVKHRNALFLIFELKFVVYEYKKTSFLVQNVDQKELSETAKPEVFKPIYVTLVHLDLVGLEKLRKTIPNSCGKNIFLINRPSLNWLEN